jgi:hypothetical protein
VSITRSLTIRRVRLNQRGRSISHTASCIKGHPEPVFTPDP